MTAFRTIAFTVPLTFFCVCDPCHADNHRPFTYEWMASEAEVIAIGKFEESKRVLPNPEQSTCSAFVSRVRVLFVFKGTPTMQSLTVIHHRWAREGGLPLANSMFAEMPKEMAIAMDSVSIGERVDVTKYPGLYLMFLRHRDGKYAPVTGPAWENYSIQFLSGNFDFSRQEDDVVNKGQCHNTTAKELKEDKP